MRSLLQASVCTTGRRKTDRVVERPETSGYFHHVSPQGGATPPGVDPTVPQQDYASTSKGMFQTKWPPLFYSQQIALLLFCEPLFLRQIDAKNLSAPFRLHY